MDNKEKIERLKKNNPFSSSSVGNPRENLFPIVKTINKRTYDSLLRLINQKIKNPSMPLASTILGGPGSGKSQLISQLYKNFSSSNIPFILSYIQPIENPDRPYRYLLKEIVSNLSQPKAHDTSLNQLMMLIASMYCGSFLENMRFKDEQTQKKILIEFKKNPVYIFKSKKISENHLKKIENHIKRDLAENCSLSLLKVLFQYRSAEKRYAVMEWLKGEILDDETAKLINADARNGKTELALEQEARDILKNLSFLISKFKYSMLICFDRLENLDTQSKIEAFGKLVEFIVDSTRAMFPTVCCREHLWENKLASSLNGHVVERLKANFFVLEPCNKFQAQELINSRLSWAYQPDRLKDVNDIYPFTGEHMKFFEGGFKTPREVLIYANNELELIINGSSHVSVGIFEQLQLEFEKHYKLVFDNFNRYQPDRDRLRRTFQIFFEHNELFPVDTFKEVENDKFIDFQFELKHESKNISGIIIIDVEQRFQSINASIKRGIEFLKNNKPSYVLYVRDGRCEIKDSWKTTNKMFDEFVNLGGHKFILNNKLAAQCYALTQLRYNFREGDISIIDPGTSRNRVFTWNEFIDFLPEAFKKEIFSFFKLINDTNPFKEKTDISKIETTPTTTNKLVMKKVLEVLSPLPMMMCESEHLLNHLVETINVDMKQMLSVIKRFSDRFAIIPSKDNKILIILKKEWINANPQK